MGWLSYQQGRRSEQTAKQWLQAQGVQVLCENFRAKGGEIDLIGQLPDTTVVFFEVKQRRNAQHGHPAEYVTAQKQAKLVRAAQVYLLKHPHLQAYPQRFDLLTLIDQNPQPEWLENIIVGG